MSEDRSPDGDTRPRSWWVRFTQSLRGNLGDQEDVLALLREANDRQLIDTDALRMIEGVFRVGDSQVRDVMVPRAQMEVVEISSPIEEIIRHVVEVGHSRFPVIGDGRDDIRGILLAKDLLRACQANGPRELRISSLLRPVTFIPESKHLDLLLEEFRTNRNHMAIVVDEYGGTAGLVTIEDVLEIIVGDIEDEYDIDEDVMMLPRENGEFIVNALIPLEDFNESLGISLDGEGVDTLGGYVAMKMGRLPRAGDRFQLDGGLELQVTRADRRRVYTFRLSRQDHQQDMPAAVPSRAGAHEP